MSTEHRRARGGAVLGVLGELLVTVGLVVLLFVGWQVWWVTAQATSASATVVDDLGKTFTAQARTLPAAPATDGTALRDDAIPVGDAFALVTVPRFGNGPQPVLQGTAVAQLDRGVGHEKGSAMPGRIGNFATAGHRDTYSHPYGRIDTLVAGDRIVVEVNDGWAIYAVVRDRIVPPTAVEVYAPVPDKPGATPTEAWMTLVACEPHWTAQSRWVVHAKLDRWVPRTADRPTAEANPEVAAALKGK